MANRFPLILNTSSNQIQELASGDTLDLTGSGLNLTGITTLSTSAQLNLGGGTNINTGTRGDILVYNSSGRITKLTLGASGKVLKSNGSDIVFGDVGATTNVYYVAKNGTDASGFGGSIDTPFASIKYAVANIGTPSATAPAIIFVKAGLYEEVQLPIVVPAHTTIAGDSIRATVIKPGAGNDSGGSVLNTRSTLFKMSNATVLQDVVMDGMGGYTPGSPNYKPESATIGGVYLALNNSSPVSTKSPYIYNCTSFGNGATGAVLDGSVHASGNRSMLFHTYTAVHSDGLGVFLKNNANAEMISTFTYYCTVGFAAIGGSKIRSLNSSNAYGEYGVYSAGFDSGETANSGTIKGQMLVYTNVLTTSFTDGEQVTGGTSGATGYVVNVQAEPKRIYIVQKSGTFQSSETVTGGSSGATATLTSGTATVNQSGRILVTTFSTAPDAGDSLQFASTDGNAYQIQSVSSVTANSVAYKVLVFSTSRATAVAENVNVLVRKEFSLARLTGHDFLQVGTGGTDTTNWPNNPTQSPAQADQVVTNETDPGRVYYTATDDLGNFYVGDQFKVDQATGNVTLDASAFNLSGLESLRLGSVGGLIGAAVGEFSTDVTMSQNSDTKVSTQKAVKTYVDTLDGTTPVGGTFTVAGISTVTGTTQFTKQLNVSGVSTFHGNVNLLDGDRLRVGSSEDLQIYHDSNHSYIAENGGGDLKIQASAGSIFIQKSTGEEMIKATVDGSVELYHDDVVRLTTTSTGVSIGGSLTVPGNVSIGGTLTYEDVTNIDSVGVVTARNGLKVTGGTSFFAGAIAAAGAITGTASTATNVTVADESSDTTCFPTFVTAATGNLPPKTGTNLTFNSSNGTLTATTVSAFNATITGDNADSLNFTNNTSSDNRGISFNDRTAISADYNDGYLRINNQSEFSNGIFTPGVFRADGGINWNGNQTIVDGSGQINASRILTGTVPVAQIGTGTKNTSTFYRGDGTFATVTAPAITAINSASNNRIVTSDGGTTVTAEGNFTFDGSTAVINAGNSALKSKSSSNGNQTVVLSSGSARGDTIGVTNTSAAGIFWSTADGYGIYKTAGSWSGNYQQLKLEWNTGIILDGGTAYGLSGVRFSSHALPTSNNTYDLGNSSLRWRNIYTNDLNLSNEGGTNDVDGTWGNYTIQEGESDLFLINKRNGKKYKFNLTEVS